MMVEKKTAYRYLLSVLALLVVGIVYYKMVCLPLRVSKPFVFSHHTTATLQRLLKSKQHLQTFFDLEPALNTDTYPEFKMPLRLAQAHAEAEVSIVAVLQPLVSEPKGAMLLIEAQWPRTYNPLRQLAFYQEAVRFKKQLDASAIKRFQEQDLDTLLYGCTIKQEQVRYEFLMTATHLFSHKPTQEAVYQEAARLRAYILRQGAKIEDSLMLYMDTIQHRLMIAFPISKKIKDHPVFKNKRMVKGRILHVQVKGGLAKVQKAHQNVLDYIQDKALSMPAIDYEVLSSRRMGDSSQWLTDLYFPIY